MNREERPKSWVWERIICNSSYKELKDNCSSRNQKI